MQHRVVVLALAGLVVACATSPLGRRQLAIVPDAEMNALGVQAFDQMKSDIPRSTDPRVNRFVACVADAVTGSLSGAWAGRSWEVVVFEEGSANAFALPGGKIGVHTGLLKVARDQDQLATVIGHEVAHVVANHSNERVSQQVVAQGGLQAAEAMMGGANTPGKQLLMGAFGLGAQYGVLLPYGRTQENEADLLGLDLMAKAGFDPSASVALWRNMGAAGGAQPPEWASTHPSHATRIAELERRIPSARRLAEQARAAGRTPRCS